MMLLHQTTIHVDADDAVGARALDLGPRSPLDGCIAITLGGPNDVVIYFPVDRLPELHDKISRAAAVATIQAVKPA